MRTRRVTGLATIAGCVLLATLGACESTSKGAGSEAAREARTSPSGGMPATETGAGGEPAGRLGWTFTEPGN